MSDEKDRLKAHVDKKHPQTRGKVESAFKPEVSVLKGVGFIGAGSTVVDVKNGRIVRIRPLHYDWKYTKEELANSMWKIEARGKTFKPLMKSLPSYFAFGYKKRVYSPNRIKYPLKRVDWDPNGERNPQNRGKSKYKRISWDEATTLIADEIKRVQAKYGPYSLLLKGMDGHVETKTVHQGGGSHVLCMSEAGGYTCEVRNADSWEGWFWGSTHVWGTGYSGHHWPMATLLDISKNTDMIVFQGGDWETTPSGGYGHFLSQVAYWFTQTGIKQVYICPDLNYAAAIHADKWIPVLPNTDAALQLAIIYTWITEGTYDKDYVKTHTVGMDKVEEYVLGKEDGVPKTPAWASQKCGVPEWTIKALAREWASKRTSTGHFYGGSFIRGPYSHEPARLESILLGMQGLGKPGVHQIASSWFARVPRRKGAAIGIMGIMSRQMSKCFTITPQIIPRTMLHYAILNPPVTSWGNTAIGSPVEDQFMKYTYPIPKEQGGTEIHMMWSEKPCNTACWNGGNLYIEAVRSPKIECVVEQQQWLENDCVFADIVLPVTTNFEEEDIGTADSSQVFECWGQAIKPVGEAKSDYEIACEVARKLGVYKEVTEGKTIKEWIKDRYEVSFVKELISWEELKEKGYYMPPVATDWEKDPSGLIKFYEDPEANPLPTPSGKLEFYSARLAEHFPDDDERPPIPKWIEKSETHDERLSSERARMFPLLMMSNHGRWRMHAQCDDISWFREIPTCKVKGYDGYMYEPVWLHPSTAEKRGIKNGDIVKVYNERGVVLCGAYVTERLMTGVAYVDHGARVDLITDRVDRGGSINLITPSRGISKNCWGMATSGFLVEVERVSGEEMDEWRKNYPESFKREYDPAAGLRFNAWIEVDTK
jgi:anaerobic selenocysteine-containing dehydrogenase